MRRIDLVIFDCDGVLIDSEAISARMLVEELRERAGLDEAVAEVSGLREIKALRDGRESG